VVDNPAYAAGHHQVFSETEVHAVWDLVKSDTNESYQCKFTSISAPSRCSPPPCPRSPHLVLQDALWYLSTAAAPHKLICCALEGHPAIQQGDVQVEHKAQDVCAAGSLAKTQGRG
jgi:hypothetical protein